MQPNFPEIFRNQRMKTSVDVDLKFFHETKNETHFSFKIHSAIPCLTFLEGKYAIEMLFSEA